MPQEMTFGEALLAAIDEVAEQDKRIVLFNPSFAGEAGQRNSPVPQKICGADKIPAHRRDRFLRHRHRRRNGRPAAGGRPQHRDVFLRSDPADRQRSRHRLLELRRTNQRAGVLYEFGIRGGGGVQHSGSPQSWYWNTPGLQIVMPSTPADAKGLMRTVLLKSEDPTIFFGHDRLLDDAAQCQTALMKYRWAKPTSNAQAET